MRIDFTSFVKPRFRKIALRIDAWEGNQEKIQRELLLRNLKEAAETEYGRKYGFSDILNSKDPYAEFSKIIPTIRYEDIRAYVIRMIKGESNILWPGVCKDFAQSSGTSGGKSKYIPITARSLKGNHFRGGEDAVAHFINNNPSNKIF